MRMVGTIEIFAADFKAAPFWWEAVTPDDAGSVPPPAETEVAVVGSGYGGLSASLEPARHGIDVTVLEAGLLGQGARTRHGGHDSGGGVRTRGEEGKRVEVCVEYECRGIIEKQK